MDDEGKRRAESISAGPVTLVDAHVHVYPEADVSVLLGSAWANFSAAATALGSADFSAVIMLAESRGHRWFDRTLECGAVPAGWSVSRCHDSVLAVHGASFGTPGMLIVRGLQVVTAEGIEVLSLGTSGEIPDRLDLEETLRLSAASAAFTVLPWGVGKWLGRRGRLVTRAIESSAPNALLVGDNGGRPAFWPEPGAIADARRRSIPVLSGTDPLPVPGDERRAGSFGVWLRGSIDRGDPLHWLRERLVPGAGHAVRAYGQPLGTGDFVRGQLALRRRRDVPTAGFAKRTSA